MTRPKNVDRWKKLTYLMDYQEAGTPKPGATVLAQMNAGARKLPLLVTQNYGRGRTAMMATSGTWRWQMSQPLGDPATIFSGSSCCAGWCWSRPARWS